MTGPTDDLLYQHKLVPSRDIMDERIVAQTPVGESQKWIAKNYIVHSTGKDSSLEMKYCEVNKNNLSVIQQRQL